MPDDHWVWELNPKDRSEEVKKALAFYHRFGKEIEAIRAAAEDIKAALANGVQLENRETEKDDRLFDALDRFLNF